MVVMMMPPAVVVMVVMMPPPVMMMMVVMMPGDAHHIAYSVCCRVPLLALRPQNSGRVGDRLQEFGERPSVHRPIDITGRYGSNRSHWR
jgi:hypothetical protein